MKDKVITKSFHIDCDDPPDSLDGKINHYWDKEYPGRKIEIIKSVPMDFGAHRTGLTIHFRIRGKDDC